VIAALVVAAVLGTALIWSLVDVARRPAAAFVATRVPKGSTVLLIAASGGIGGIYYLLRVRPIVTRATPRLPPELRPPTAREEYRRWKQSGRDAWS